MNKANKINQLTITRFIAAIGIVIFHFGKSVYPFNNSVLAILINNSNVAVSYFFTLSGFVMIVAYGRGKAFNPKIYYTNRIAKIYPMYLLAILLIIPFLTHIDYLKLTAEVLLFHATIPTLLPAYNLADWSLSVELFFYIIFPFLYNRLYLNASLKKVVVITIFLWLSSQIVNFKLHEATVTHYNFVYYNPLLHLNEFLAGSLLGLCYQYYASKKYLRSDFALLLFLMVTVCLCLSLPLLKTYNIKYPVNIHNGLLVVFFAPLILLLSLNTGLIAKALSCPVLVFLGEISYGVYILQFPLYAIFVKCFDIANPESAFYSYLMFLIVCSSLAYYMVELPGKRLVKWGLRAL